MMQNPTITIAGNLTADPELRFTPNGKAVVGFTIAQTPRVKVGDEWKDGTPTFLRCELWGPAAENTAESFAKGARVLAVGELRTDQWTDKDNGDKRTAVKLIVHELGASIQYATVQVRKAQRHNGGDVPPPVDPFTSEAATEDTAPAGAQA